MCDAIGAMRLFIGYVCLKIDSVYVAAFKWLADCA